jgi:hypothetical protein
MINRLGSRLLPPFAVATAVAVLAAGCGGGSDASGASSLSKAEFIKQANAGCKKERAGLMERIADFERRRAGKKPREYADAVHFVFLPTIEAEVWEIGKLDAPPSEEKPVYELLSDDRTAIDAVAVIPRVPSIKAAERHFTAVGKMFRASGLPACAHGLDQPRR